MGFCPVARYQTKGRSLISPVTYNIVRYMKEIWKDVVGWEGIYHVSSIGRVRRVKPYKLGRRVNEPLPRIMNYNCKDSSGYPHIGLADKGSGKERQTYKIHRLVAAAFLGPIPEGKQVNHKNSTRDDNRIENLEYVTPQENTLHGGKNHKYGHLLRGSSHKLSKLNESDVKQIKQFLREGKSQTSLAELFGVTQAAISLIKNEITWRHIR